MTLANYFIAGVSSIALMEISSPDEREKVLGPLFVTAVGSDVPVCGPNKFSLTESKSALNAEVKKSLYSREDLVVDLLAMLEKPVVRDKAVVIDKEEVDLGESKQALPLEIDHLPVSHKYGDQDHANEVMLQRAIKGYLFDCSANIDIVGHNQPLKKVWSWVRSKLSYSITGTCLNAY